MAACIGLSDRDPVRIFNNLPGRFNLVGQHKPHYIVDMEIAANKAWKAYFIVVDKYEDGFATQHEVDTSRDTALEMQRAYYAAIEDGE